MFLSLDKIMLVASLIGLNFYFFNTQMHEHATATPFSCF